MYVVISIFSTSLCIQSYKYLFFRKLLIAFSTDAPPKKKRPQFSVVSTINRKDRALYSDAVAQQLQHRKSSVILVRRIFRKFHNLHYTGTVVHL